MEEIKKLFELLFVKVKLFALNGCVDSHKAMQWCWGWQCDLVFTLMYTTVIGIFTLLHSFGVKTNIKRMSRLGFSQLLCFFKQLRFSSFYLSLSASITFLLSTFLYLHLLLLFLLPFFICICFMVFSFLLELQKK